MITVGILALQGAFLEHVRSLAACGSRTVEVRKAEQLDECQALIIPGGESTTIGKLMDSFGLWNPVRRFAAAGRPIFGTCAGMVLLAKDIEGSEQPRLGLMDIAIKRNAFGRQVDSFEADIHVPVLGEKPVRGVFIRAPFVTAVGSGVETLASFDGKVILVRQGKLLAGAFHPELTTDTRLHQYFLNFLNE
ncbi:MAG: pyridoxal 5'-phosphate synthase glutaminase subunit PdxT [Candidatus Desulforudis sp.]|nr:pyridoxal 5'-phosphate synthase glutaminase subunit PdxT [Desulforudis sp.]